MSGVEAVRFRRDVTEPRPVTPVSRVAHGGEQAAVLHLGAQALALAGRQSSADSEQSPTSETEPETTAADEESGTRASGNEAELTEDERRQVSELRRRDREVRTHEQTHKTIGGQHTGAIHLEYETGADGKRYAVSGSVPIDSSPVEGDPEATLRKMETVKRAASAPANPSGADRQVAAQAAQLAVKARAELAAQSYAKAEQLGSDAATKPANAANALTGPAPGAERPSGERLAIFA